MDQTPAVGPNGEIQSVYRNSSSKGELDISTVAFCITQSALDLSLEAIHQMLMKRNLTPSGIHITQTIFFLTEGISIQKDQ
jgi:hypothetical protein